ncbi:hypothetical protein MSG28_011707, partial [Choristoneura fumiferana]
MTSTPNRIHISVEEINKSLPDCIRVFDVKRVTNKFNSKCKCNARTYSYTLPTYTFEPTLSIESGEDRKKYRITPEKLEQVNSVLGFYKGTKHFNDPSASRYMMGFSVEKVFVESEMEFAVHYDRYDTKFKDSHDSLTWTEVEETVQKFTHDHIYPNIVKGEVKDDSMALWLEKLKKHSYEPSEDEPAEKDDEKGDESDDENEDDEKNLEKEMERNECKVTNELSRLPVSARYCASRRYRRTPRPRDCCRPPRSSRLHVFVAELAARLLLKPEGAVERQRQRA